MTDCDSKECIKCHKEGVHKGAYMNSAAYLAKKEGDAPVPPQLQERLFVCADCLQEFTKTGGKAEDFTCTLHKAEFKVSHVIGQAHAANDGLQLSTSQSMHTGEHHEKKKHHGW